MTRVNGRLIPDLHWYHDYLSAFKLRNLLGGLVWETAGAFKLGLKVLLCGLKCLVLQKLFVTHLIKT